MALSSNEKWIIVAVVAILGIFVVWFEVRYMMGKSREAKRSSQRKDEAYNAILTTRSVINIMNRQGSDTRSAQRMVDNAKRAMQSGDYERCMSLCEEAREEMKNPPRSPEPSAAEAQGWSSDDREDLEKVAERILSVDKVAPPADSYKGTKLSIDQDGNYLSARFEINTAKADINKAVDAGADVSSAQALLSEAESAFASGSYSKALSCAIKSRKSLSSVASVETIPLRVPAEGEEEEAEPTPEEASRANAPTCRECGFQLDRGDTFCGKCGARVVVEKVCRECGAKAKPSDTFCRKCGARI